MLGEHYFAGCGSFAGLEPDAWSVPFETGGKRRGAGVRHHASYDTHATRAMQAACLPVEMGRVGSCIAHRPSLSVRPGACGRGSSSAGLLLRLRYCPCIACTRRMDTRLKPRIACILVQQQQQQQQQAACPLPARRPRIGQSLPGPRVYASAASFLLPVLLCLCSVAVAADGPMQMEWRGVNSSACSRGYGCGSHGQCLGLFGLSDALLAQRDPDPYAMDLGVTPTCVCDAGWSSALVLISWHSKVAASHRCTVPQHSLLAVHLAWGALALGVCLYSLHKLSQSVRVIRDASEKKLLKAAEDRLNQQGGGAGDMMLMQQAGGYNDRFAPELSVSRRGGGGSTLFLFANDPVSYTHLTLPTKRIV